MTHRRQADASVVGQLREHVVVKFQSGVNARLSGAIEVHNHVNVRLRRLAPDFSPPFRAPNPFRYLVPVWRGEHDVHPYLFAHVLLSPFRCLQQNTLSAQVVCQFHVGSAVANYKRALQIVAPVHIFREHSRSRFPCRRVVFREVAVNELRVKTDAFAAQRVEHFLMRRPKRILRKRRRSETVLVAHHDQFVALADHLSQGRNHARNKLQFLQTVDLLVGWFLDDGPVAVNEYGAFAPLPFRVFRFHA